MKSMWGEELEIGDFVLILNKTIYNLFSETTSYTGNYGIVVSSKSVYDGDSIKHLKYLYKIDTNTIRPEELEIKNNLISNYKKLLDSQVKKTKNKKDYLKSSKNLDIKPGFIVSSKESSRDFENVYIYFGKVRITDTTMNGSEIQEGYMYLGCSKYAAQQLYNISLNTEVESFIQAYSKYNKGSDKYFMFMGSSCKLLKNPSSVSKYVYGKCNLKSKYSFEYTHEYSLNRASSISTHHVTIELLDEY